jgi:DNA (cytosine-5)-methyltransferase 1
MPAYYNEHDPKAAAWLRELIKAGMIAPGEVDERSIEDVIPNELAGFDQCHFFAGIGVWSYALRLAGWPDDRPVWTGSCPCQPFSAAGKGEGTADERHLWPALHFLIEQRRPAVFLGEQVASKDGLAWLDIVHSDLAAAGYAIGAADLCAAGVGAPHIRQRLWIVGKRLEHAESDGWGEWRAEPSERSPERGRSAGGMADADCYGPEKQLGQSGEREPACRSGSSEAGFVSRLGDTCGQGLPEQFGERGILRQADGGSEGQAAVGGSFDGGMANAEGSGSGAGLLDSRSTGERRPFLADNGSDGRMADAERRAAERHGHKMGSAPGGVQGQAREQWLRDDARDGIATGRPGPTNGHWRAADWLHCRDGKWRPVEPGTFPLAHGTSGRVGRLRGYGNAIVAQAAQAFIESVM